MENGVHKSTTFKEWKVALNNADTKFKKFQIVHAFCIIWSTAHTF